MNIIIGLVIGIVCLAFIIAKWETRECRESVKYSCEVLAKNHSAVVDWKCYMKDAPICETSAGRDLYMAPIKER